MKIEDYLRLVANKVEEASNKQDWNEVERLLRECLITLRQKIEEAV